MVVKKLVCRICGKPIPGLKRLGDHISWCQKQKDVWRVSYGHDRVSSIMLCSPQVKQSKGASHVN